MAENTQIQWHEPLDGGWFQYKKDVFQLMIPQGSTAIDIGAHCGVFSLWFGCCVGEKGKVLAFEPNPTTYAMLEKYSGINKSLNITPYEYAITPETKKYTFHYTDSNRWGTATNGGFFNELEKKKDLVEIHTQEVEVEGVNLFDFLKEKHPEDLDKISLIKMDTEGNDKEIIKTLSPIIERCTPLLVVEAFESLSKDEIKDYFESIITYDYLIYDISPMDNPIDCMGPLNLKEFEHNIYKVNKNGNFLCIHKDRVSEYKLPTTKKGKSCIVIAHMNNPNTHALKLKSQLDSAIKAFDEVIFVDYNSTTPLLWQREIKTSKIKHFVISQEDVQKIMTQIHPGVVEEDEISKHFNKSLAFNIGLKRTDAEIVAFADLKSVIPSTIDKDFYLRDVNTFHDLSDGTNNLQIATKNLWLKIRGAEERMADQTAIFENNKKKAELYGFYINSKSDSSVVDWEWVDNFQAFKWKGFHDYEYLVSRNHPYIGLSNIQIESQIV